MEDKAISGKTSTITIKKRYEKALEKRYFKLPFEMPENVESFTVDYYFDKHGVTEDGKKRKNEIDFGVIDAGGRQVCAVGKVRSVYFSEAYSSDGCHIDKLTPGTWQIIVGLNVLSYQGVEITYNITFRNKELRWLKGDPHLHTRHSDGRNSPEKLIDIAKKAKLDFIIITDHNNNEAGRHKYQDKALTIIEGEEITTFKGHINMFGINSDFADVPFSIETHEEIMDVFRRGKEKGAVMVLNHPTCKKCGFRYPYTDFPYDCIEVWNGPMRIDNMTAVEMWHNELLKGYRCPAVGGSDYHQDYFIIRLLAMPCMRVLAESASPEDILNAIKTGRSVITSSENSAMLYINSGETEVGGSVKWNKDSLVTVRAEGIKRGHELIIYNNDAVIYKEKAKKRNFTVTLPVKEKGFVRAEIRYSKNFIEKKIHNAVVKALLPQDVGLPVPDFINCLTNPIYFE